MTAKNNADAKMKKINNMRYRIYMRYRICIADKLNIDSVDILNIDLYLRYINIDKYKYIS